MTENYYSILGVSPQASQDEIKKAYKKAAIKNHPDRGGDHVRMVQCNEAYAILGDPVLRREYDLLLETPLDDQCAEEWQQETAATRAAARHYPQKWSDFEKWMDGLVIDIKRAKYSSEKIYGAFSMPMIHGSLSGTVFCLAGAILVMFVCSDVYQAIYRVDILKEPGNGFWDQFLSRRMHIFMKPALVAGPIVVGAWVGAFLHKLLNDILAGNFSSDSFTSSTVNKQPTGSGQEYEILPCPTCGQKLRLPKVKEELAVTCPKCRTNFNHSAGKA